MLSWNSENISYGYLVFASEFVFIFVYVVTEIFLRSTSLQSAYSGKQIRRRRKTSIHF